MKGDIVDLVQLLPFERRLGRIDDEHLLVVIFHDRLAVDGIVLEILHAEGIGVCLAVGFEQIVGIAGGQGLGRYSGIGRSVMRKQRLPVEKSVVLRHRIRDFFAHLAEIRRPAHIPDLLHGHPLAQKLRQSDNGAFPHAVHENIRAGIDQNGAADLVVPVVVMGAPPERRFQTADEDRNVSVCLAHAVAVDDGGAVGAESGLAAGGIVVLAASFFGGGIVGDHGIDVPGGNEKAKARLPEAAEIVCGPEIRLTEHGAGEAVFFQHPRDESRPERGMIDIGVAADIHEIGLFAAQLLGRYREKMVRKNHSGVLSSKTGCFPGAFYCFRVARLRSNSSASVTPAENSAIVTL